MELAEILIKFGVKESKKREKLVEEILKLLEKTPPEIKVHV